MIRQCTIIFGCLAIGELIAAFLPVKIPSSIIGMLLLTFFLRVGWIKLSWVRDISAFLSKNIAFFFVPAGVAVMLYLDILKANAWSILIAAVISTILTLAATGLTHQYMRKKTGSLKNKKHEHEEVLQETNNPHNH
ncbi:MAG: CidA/LrgA family protein [Niabella sp.]